MGGEGRGGELRIVRKGREEGRGGEQVTFKDVTML